MLPRFFSGSGKLADENGTPLEDAGGDVHGVIRGARFLRAATNLPVHGSAGQGPSQGEAGEQELFVAMCVLQWGASP